MSETAEHEFEPAAADETQQPAPPRDDDDAQYSERVRRRIAKSTRERREAEQQAETARALLARSEAERIELARKVAAYDLEKAQADAKRAYTEGDADGQVNAATAIARANARHEAAQAMQPAPPPAPRRQVDDVTQRWIDENPWFESDAAAQATALRAHRVAEAEGIPSGTPEYFRFIDQRVKQEHPHLFEDGEAEPAAAPVERVPTRAAPAAAPAHAAYTPPARRTVPAAQAKPRLPSLTADQVAMATHLGMTGAEYAAELVRLQAQGKIGR